MCGNFVHGINSCSTYNVGVVSYENFDHFVHVLIRPPETDRPERQFWTGLLLLCFYYSMVHEDFHFMGRKERGERKDGRKGKGGQRREGMDEEEKERE